MFNNVKAKKRLTQVLVAFVIICMSVTGSLLLLDDFIKESSAAGRVVDIPAGNGTELKNAIAGVSSGETVTINVPAGNYTVSGKFGTVDAGETVTIALAKDAVVYWDNEICEKDQGPTIMAQAYTGSTYSEGKYCGLIENSGNLTIAGSGTIRIRQIESITSGGSYDNLVQRVYTIVNKANATLKLDGVNVESYLSFVQTKADDYQQAFVYNAAVYNEGTVNTTATIKAGSMVGTGVYASLTGRSNQAYSYSFAYGIYGGTVNMNGGSILVDSYAGFINTDPASSGNKGRQCHAYACAVGIYSNDAKITGNSTINVLSKDWRSKSSNNPWDGGVDHLFSVGVLSTDTYYPIIGPSVDVVASYEHIGNTKIDIHIPGATDANQYWSNVYSEKKGGNASWTATPVLQVSKVQNNIGKHNSEKTYDADGGFFGATTPWGAIGENNAEKYQYRTTQAYFSGSDSTVQASQVNGGGENEHTIKSVAIVNGVPGKSGTSTPTSARAGVPGDYSPKASSLKNENQGSQYLVVYRFYKDVNNIESVSFRADKSKLKNEASITVGSTTNSTSGIIPDSKTKIQYVSGGETINSNFYEFKGAYYETVESANSGLVNRLSDISNGSAKTPSKWAGSKGLLPNDGVTVTDDKDNTIIIYLDYEKLDPAIIDVVAADKGTGITAGTNTTSFTVPYTGANLIPGEDFDFGIIDTKNEKVVTNDYNYLREANSSKINVEYEYTSDKVNWNAGLPKDVGTYTIRVKVGGDDVTYNRAAATIDLDATITPATVTISGPNSKSVIYGSTYAEIFDFSAYTAKNKSGATVNGTWSLEGAVSTAVPDVGNYTNLKIVWRPTSADGRNYGTAEYPVTLAVTQRAVTVKIGSGTATYGDAKFASNDFITFENLPVADNNKTADWIANTTFTVEGANGTNEFAAGLPVGSYKLKIESTKFGGATNQNYSFSFTDGTLSVQKKDIFYTAEAAGKTYDGSKDVTVTLRYSAGIFGGDPFDTVYYNVPGTMASANAGENKVTVDISKITVNSNYNLVVGNADTVTAVVAKADPTGVAVVAKPAVVTYDKTKTLKSIALDPTGDLAGTWAWETETTVPHVNQNKYVAVFTPADTTNYNTLKQDVTLTVNKKDVTVTVDAITVEYGENVPVLPVKYVGFTGGDTLATIEYEGNATASTTYTPGSGVDKKYPISVATTLESENYNFVKKDSEITVTPKALTVTAANDSIVYGTVAPEYNATDVTATGFYGSDSLSSINATVKVTTTYIAGTVTGKVGTYPINVEVTTANKNYNITTVAGTLTVTKAVLTVTPNAKTITFGADVPEYTVAGTDYAVTGFVNGDTLARVTITGAPVFTTSYTNESFVNSYPVTAVVTNMSSANYTFVGASGTIKVVQATPSVTTAPTASVVNSHSLADAAFSNTAVVVNPNDSAVNVPGSFAFTNSSAVPAWGSSNSYEAVFTPDDTINYTTAKVNVKVTVTVKTISGTPVIQGSAMEGSTLTVNLAAMDPTTASSYTYQWYVGNTAVATGSSYKINEADIGKTIYVVLDAIEANGFTGTATSAKTDAVIKALLETTAKHLKVSLPTGIVYDAMPHSGTVAIADGYNANYFGTPVLKYNGSTEAPVTAGTYVVTVDVSTPAEPEGGYPENTYHGPATGIVVGEIVIARAPYTVTVLANDKVYDGTVTATATITGSGLKNETDDVYLADTARYSFANANAGANKAITVTNVALLGKDAGNYEVVIEPTTASILPRVIYYRASGVDKFYDGLNTVAVEFTYDAGKNGTNSDWGYASVDNASTVYLTNGTAVATDVNAGEGIIIAEIKATPSGTSSNNYEFRISNEATATVNIKKAPVSVTTPVISGIVYDSTKPLSTIDLSHLNTSEGYWAFNDATIVPTVKQKSYAATYYSKNANYADETAGTITVNVTPKEVILTADDKTVTYGANAPTYTISASGFTGSDTLAMIGGNINATSTYAPGSDIGSYTIRITEALTRDNYTFVTRDGYLTVAHATINITASAVNKIYDGNTNVTVNFSKLSTAAGVYVNDLGKVGLSFEKTTGQAKTANAGSTTVSYTAPTLIGDKAKNYQLNITPKTGVLTVVIEKADLADVIFPTNGQVEYGYDLSYATFETEGVGDGTFEYENAKLTVPGDLGVYNTYKVIFTPTDPNYNTQEDYVTLNVIKCTLNYVVGISGKLQEGQTLTVVTTGLPAKATDFISYQWYRYDGEEFVEINGANGKNYVATDKDIGYTLVVMTSFDGSAPYIFADGVVEEIEGIFGICGESEDTIKEINLTFWQRLMDWIYRIIAVLTGVRLGGGLGL